jgi:hypothetical protein
MYLFLEGLSKITNTALGQLASNVTELEAGGVTDQIPIRLSVIRIMFSYKRGSVLE